jgi:hypothetical protein
MTATYQLLRWRQGFELYGALRMGLAEEEAEDVVNPPGLTEEEEGLLERHNAVQGSRKLSWDPKVLLRLLPSLPLLPFPRVPTRLLPSRLVLPPLVTRPPADHTAGTNRC